MALDAALTFPSSGPAEPGAGAASRHHPTPHPLPGPAAASPQHHSGPARTGTAWPYPRPFLGLIPSRGFLYEQIK